MIDGKAIHCPIKIWLLHKVCTNIVCVWPSGNRPRRFPFLTNHTQLHRLTQTNVRPVSTRRHEGINICLQPQTRIDMRFRRNHPSVRGKILFVLLAFCRSSSCRQTNDLFRPQVAENSDGKINSSQTMIEIVNKAVLNFPLVDPILASWLFFDNQQNEG